MTQIFVFGSSLAYGVGGTNGGWADILKQKLNHLMFSDQGVGEKYEFFNFAKSGEPISFVSNTFKNDLEKYRRKGKIIILVSIGGNNSRAKDEPDNFVSTIEEYQKEMFELLSNLKKNADEVMFVGGGCYDESKTYPKPDPLTGGRSYFSNKRGLEFKKVLERVCSDLGVKFIQNEVEDAEWIEKYLYKDGLHPNQSGHELIAEKVWLELKPLLD